MKKRELVSAILALMLLTGCASKMPLEPAAEPVPEIPVLEAREAYQLAEIPVQELHNGDEVTVDGVCTFTVKGFGAGRTITADGSTCAGAKAGQTLVWVTCDYVNLTQDEVSPGRLVEKAVLRLESGSSDGKSASFAQILPGEAAEIYIFYAIPEDLSEQPLTAQFTIDGQTYSYEIPADRAGVLTPTLPEPEEPEEEPKEEPEQEPITLQELPKQESNIQTEENTSSKEEKTESLPERVMREDGGYYIYEYDSAGRVIKCMWYDANGECVGGYGNKFDETGYVAELYSYGKDGNVGITKYFTAGKLMRRETESGFVSIYEYDGEFIRVSDYKNGVYLRTWIFQNGQCIGYLEAGDEEMIPWTQNYQPCPLK